MKLVREFLFAMVFVGMCVPAFSQTVPQEDNFTYTASSNLANQGFWLNNGVSGNSVTVTGFSLNYSGYPWSGTDNAAVFGTGREGIGWAFQILPAELATGVLYYSFMIKVDSASFNGSNIVSLASSQQSEDGALLYVKNTGTGWKFGIKKVSTGGAAGPTYTSGEYVKTDTQVIVVKYGAFNGGDFDSVRLWVNPDLSGAEPAPTATIFDTGIGDALGFNYLEFHEQASAESTYYYIDGTRVGFTWATAPLPVQMVSFAVMASRLDANLRWSTASEVNNYGFNIERRATGEDQWQKVGFVQGWGTSMERREYDYVDAGLSAGRYAYRVKQLDLDGTFTYFAAAEVEVGAAPKELALEPNYPNPFNPATQISFTVPEDGKAVLKVYNMLGQEVAVLFDEVAEAGKLYQKRFDASSLPTGVYVSRLEYGGRSVMRKMLFVK